MMIKIGLTTLTLMLCLPSLASAHRLDKGDCILWPQHGEAYGSEGYYTYEGGCKEGMADGKGTAIWKNDFSYEEIPNSKQEGYFKAGVFLGAKYFEGEMHVSRALVSMVIDESNGMKTVVQASTPGFAAVDMCKPERVLVIASAVDQYSQDELAKKDLLKSFKVYQGVCPKTENVKLLLVGESGGKEVKIAATVVLENNKPTLTAYENSLSSQLAEQQARAQEQAEAEQQAQALKEKLNAKLQSNSVQALVNTASLDKNPFLWTGKTVIFEGALERMLSPSEALVNAPVYSPSIYVANVTPELFTQKGMLFIVKVAGKGELYAKGQYAEATFVEAINCQDENCSAELEVLTTGPIKTVRD